MHLHMHEVEKVLVWAGLKIISKASWFLFIWQIARVVKRFQSRDNNKRGENDQLVLLKVRLLPILMICLVAKKKKNRGEIDLAETCVNTDEALLQL